MSSLQRKSSRALGEILKECLRLNGIAPKINRRLIDEAWGSASGAAEYTVRTFFRDGILYVTLSSSVIRSQLIFQKNALVEKMNVILSEEILFDSNCKSTGFVKEIVLK